MKIMSFMFIQTRCVVSGGMLRIIFLQSVGMVDARNSQLLYAIKHRAALPLSMFFLLTDQYDFFVTSRVNCPCCSLLLSFAFLVFHL